MPRRTALRSVRCPRNQKRYGCFMPTQPSGAACRVTDRRANMCHLVFHLAHCATACAAPKLWSKLK